MEILQALTAAPDRPPGRSPERTAPDESFAERMSDAAERERVRREDPERSPDKRPESLDREPGKPDKNGLTRTKRAPIGRDKVPAKGTHVEPETRPHYDDHEDSSTTAKVAAAVVVETPHPVKHQSKSGAETLDDAGEVAANAPGVRAGGKRDAGPSPERNEPAQGESAPTKGRAEVAKPSRTPNPPRAERKDGTGTAGDTAESVVVSDEVPAGDEVTAEETALKGAERDTERVATALDSGAPDATRKNTVATAQTSSATGAAGDAAAKAVGDKADGTPAVRSRREIRAAGVEGAEGQKGAVAADAALLDPVANESSSDVVREITVDLGSADDILDNPAGRSGLGVNASMRGGAAETMSATSVPLGALARRLNGDLGQSIVRQAQVIMRDNNEGEIRLVIRPPELGRVRIQLQMEQGGHIAGRILVDNQSVREVIEQNLAALERAFAEAGLELGDLEVSSGDAGRSDERSATDGRAARGRQAEAFGDQLVPADLLYYGQTSINLVA